jgi:(R,R)-butanediol dehydrogenase/meso-butanediol dehydrogenase/diacetyl reductase
VNAVLDSMLDAVRPGAVVVNVAIWGAPATADMQKLVLKEIDLPDTIACVRDHPASIKMVQQGKGNLKPFITGRIALEDWWSTASIP